MHPAYRDAMLARVAAAIAHARGAREVKHRGLKGRLREILIRELFRPLLPADIGLGSGEIVTYAGRTSSEQDVVMFDRAVLPPAVMEDVYGLFPMESVLYTFEVKSVLTPTELKKSVANFTELLHDQQASWPSHCQQCAVAYKSIIPVIFAFDLGAGLKASNIVQRLDALQAPGQSYVGAVCAVGHGYWIWESPQKRWRAFPMTYEFEEVVSLLAGVMNSYRDIARSRHVRFPLGRYLLDDDAAPSSPS